jgi:hypothetical protein
MSKKTQQEIAMVIVLIVVLIFILAANLRRVMPTASQTASVEQPAAQFFKGPTEDDFLPKRQEVRKEAKEGNIPWGRDPFVLGEVISGGTETIASLKLMGITTGKKVKPMAIINNDLVFVDSKIGKFTVKKILRDMVVVSDGEKDYELKIIK